MLTTLVLARLLLPEDFGVVALVLVIINGLSLFRDMGFSQALIHRRKDIDQAADTAFVFLPVIGLALSVITVLLAPAIGAFFEIPEATSITRVLALSLVFSSFSQVPSTILERELRFKRKFVPEVAPVVGYSAAALIGAILGLGAWSLVAGELARSFLTATVVWPFSPWRPRIYFNWTLARELISYGWHIVGASVAIFIFSTLDNIAIARGLGASQLGYYVLAFTLGTLPATQIAYSVGKVLFPAYSSIQTDQQALSRAFKRTVAYVSLVASPIALGTLALGPIFLSALYGEKWNGSVRALQILSFYGLLRSTGVASGEILKSVGKPQVLAHIAYLQLILVIIPLYPIVKYSGIEGVASMFTLVIALGALIAGVIASHVVGTRFIHVFAGTVSPFAFSALSALVGWVVSSKLLNEQGIAALVGGVSAFILIYSASLFYFRRSLVLELCRLARRTLAPHTK